MLAGRPILRASSEAESSWQTSQRPKQKREREAVPLETKGDKETIHKLGGASPATTGLIWANLAFGGAVPFSRPR
jgi:hypothetical protein